MSTNEVDAPTRQAAPPRTGGIGGFADRWPFRRKLNVLVGVPLTVVGLLLAYLIADQVGQARDAAAAARLVRDSAQVAVLVDRVEAEHQQAVLLSVRYEAQGIGARPSAAAYRTAQAAVDAQVAVVRHAFGDRLPGTEAQALREIEGLSSLRDTVEQGYLPADNIDPAYTGAAKNLIDGLGLDRNAALAATFTGNLLDSLLRADAAHSSFETSVFSATTGDTNALIEFTGAVGSYELYTYQADRFARFATAAQADRLAEMEHTPAQRRIAEAYAELRIDPSSLQANTPDQIRRAFQDALGDYPSYPEQAAARLKIASSLIGEIAGSADDASADAWWRAAGLLAAALFGFLLWLGFSVAVRRSVVRPVQALTGAAQEVSAATGRELARVADDDSDDSGPPRLKDVPVTARDEIGDLAAAFNQVQSTAAALLERQVLSRRNVAEMFGNVGRRVSNLTTRQLALIDAVERGETDPALLERLYSIDHIAVRLRRNADSLMLLAGIREAVLDSGPTALTNVVRAALGQIEGYQRVRLYAGTEIMVAPDVIGDLTLMVAELLENAVAFSPAGSPVEVTVRSDAKGASIAVTDHGLGMSAERLAEENARLIRRERLDVVPTKVLGLFVVGTLARRWEVGVTLTRTAGGGVTAEVTIPSALLLPPGAAASGGDAPADRAASEATAAERNGTGGEAAAGSPGAGAVETTGPRPSTAVVPEPAADTGDEPGALPRRLPRRETSPAASDAETTEGPEPAGAPDTATNPGTAAVREPDERPERTTRPEPAVSPEQAAREQPAGRRDQAADPEPAAVRDQTARPASESASTSASASAPGSQPAVGPPAGRTPFIPRARKETDPAQAASGRTVPGQAGPGQAPASRPLRRRVRGATLRAAGGPSPSARESARPADADAVRSALEEFEAAVERAHRDTGARPAGTPARVPGGTPADPPPAGGPNGPAEPADPAPDSRTGPRAGARTTPAATAHPTTGEPTAPRPTTPDTPDSQYQNDLPEGAEQ
ncbi:sensor histidine kinase [Streptomyces sp. NRRL S-340]|uniref:sensor histidine kinase n=1 Tax=Streptomyces sp. NRRL S-340 TaxID=1463901 RepID=UPI00056489AB|nr:sensor histidine kinase [Streptomyces sp. NRRL S-340]